MSAAPHRELTVTRPLTEGADVVMLQRAHNRLCARFGLAALTVDGVFGADTLLAVRGAVGAGKPRDSGLAYYLGLEDHWQQRGHPLYRQVQIAVRAPWRRTARQKARSAARTAARKAELVNNWRQAPRWSRVTCARVILRAHAAGRVSFWSGLSTGPDLVQIQRVARGEPMVAEARMYGRRRSHPSIKMMRWLAECAAKGHRFQINALTGGTHSANTTHQYALSADIHRADREILDELRKYGGRLLDEGSHLHCSFATGRL